MSRIFDKALAGIAGLALVAARAAAADGFVAPTPAKETPWMAWGFTAVFALMIAAVAFKNSRRTHLD